MSLIRYTRNTDPLLSILDDFFPTFNYRTPQTLTTTPRSRRVRVNDTDTHTTISVSAPGLSKDDFTVTLTDGVLTVGYDTDEAADKYFTRGAFSQSWRLAKNLVSEDIAADYENGILIVKVAKTTESAAETATIPVR